MEKRNYLKKIFIATIVVMVLTIIGDATGFLSDEVFKFLRNTILAVIALYALYGLGVTLKAYGILIGKGKNKFERQTLAWGLRFIVSILSFIAIGLIGFVIYDVCTSAQISINTTLVVIYERVLIFLGAFFIFALVVFCTYNIYALYKK